jgi:hypothetical protein
METIDPATKPTLKELLLSETARGDLMIPPRGRLRRRVVLSADETATDTSDQL